MKKLLYHSHFIIQLSIYSIVLLTTCVNSPDVITYPASKEIRTSTDYTMTVNGKDVQVQKLGSTALTDSVNIANFSSAAVLSIEITAKEKIDSFLIRPKSRGLIGQKSGNKLRFTMPGPGKLQIEINKLTHLAIFANPLEVNPPRQGGNDIVYFGPGEHNPGIITLQSNQTIYIAGGAVVTGQITGTDVKNVRLAGRGIFQGSLRVKGATNLLVDGIIFNNITKRWTNTLTNCHHSAYRNVKVISYSIPWSTDGINPVGCTNFLIDDCFMRTGDDCIAIKCMDYGMHVDSITVTNCVMAGWMCNDGITLGYELNGSPVQNVLVKNCDILYARGGGATGGHSCFSIVCDGPALVKNIRFEDIRCEEQIDFKNLELICTNGTLYGKDEPGHIDGVYLKNISWENTDVPFVISGYGPANLVENITFDNCSVGGKPINSAADANFQINAFTRNIIFTNTNK